jgi:hypothetical protein
MGIWRTLLLGDWGNRMDIADNERRLQSVGRELRSGQQKKSLKDRDQDEAIEALQAEINDLQGALVTLSQVLISKGAVSEEELRRADAALEASDDTPDS